MNIDDDKKGGDIDIYIVSEIKDRLYEKKIKLKSVLEGFLLKPVDIVVAKDKNLAIEKEALCME